MVSVLVSLLFVEEDAADDEEDDGDSEELGM